MLLDVNLHEHVLVSQQTFHVIHPNWVFEDSYLDTQVLQGLAIWSYGQNGGGWMGWVLLSCKVYFLFLLGV